MVDLFYVWLDLNILLFYYILCDYFGFYNVNIGRNK